MSRSTTPSANRKSSNANYFVNPQNLNQTEISLANDDCERHKNWKSALTDALVVGLTVGGLALFVGVAAAFMVSPIGLLTMAAGFAVGGILGAIWAVHLLCVGRLYPPKAAPVANFPA
jgi:hypothetical protein